MPLIAGLACRRSPVGTLRLIPMVSLTVEIPQLFFSTLIDVSVVVLV